MTTGSEVDGRVGDDAVAPVKKAERGTRIQSVTRAAALLMAVATEPEFTQSATQLARRLGTSVPTAHHLLNTLIDAKLLARNERKQYGLGLAMEVLLGAYAKQATLPRELVDPLRWITQVTGESAYLSGWRSGELVVLANLAGTHAVQVTQLQPGYRGAAHARASGKVLLAFADPSERARHLTEHSLQKFTEHTITDRAVLDEELQRVVADGYAFDIEEFAEGVACTAVPIWHAGVLTGAYTVSAPLERFHQNREVYLARLLEAAQAVNEDLVDEA